MSILVLEHSSDEHKREVLARCECSHPKHYVDFCWYEDSGEDWNEMNISVGMGKLPFWKRIVHAMKYVFNYRREIRDYDEVILTPEEVEVLGKYLTDAAKSLKNQNETLANKFLDGIKNVNNQT